MSTSYFVNWSQDRCRGLRKNGDVGPLRAVYGSPHTSAPKLSKYGVGPGDRLFVTALDKGQVCIVAAMTVEQILDVLAFLAARHGVPAEALELHLWKLCDKLHAERPELGHELPFGCVDEVAVGDDGTSIRFDRIIPGDVLARVEVVTKKGVVRGLPVTDGRLTKPTSITGHVYRLTSKAASLFEAVLVGS